VIRATIHTDGGSRGNPGPAGIGFVIQSVSGDILAEGSESIGEATNNVAEYEALLRALAKARALELPAIDIYMDSELVVRQIQGTYRVKDLKLQPLYSNVMDLLKEFEEWSMSHVRREQNSAADALVNAALDGVVPCRAVDKCQVEAVSVSKGKYELTVRAHFDAAHALSGYPGECSELHGHTWDVEVKVEGDELDEIGIVYDFKLLKKDLRAVLDPLDHAFLNEIPPFDAVNPTAENLAQEIYTALRDRMSPSVQVTEVAVWESPEAKITFRPQDP